MNLSAEDAQELSYGSGFDGMEVVEEKITGKSRWMIVKQLVFRKEGELWGFKYQVGATENQEWEWPETVECKPAREIQVTTYQLI